MPKRTWERPSALAVAMPVAVCVVIGVFTYNIAVRAGYPVGLSVAVAAVIGLLWFGFLLSRLLG